MSQPRQVRVIGGVPFPVIEDDVPLSSAPVDFDGGCRQSPPPRRARIEWQRDECGWWTTTTIDDGRSALPRPADDR